MRSFSLMFSKRTFVFISCLSPVYCIRPSHFLFSCDASTPFRAMASPYGASRSHSLDTTHSVGLFWPSDQPGAETSTCQHTTLTRDRHPYPQRDSNPKCQQVSGRRRTSRRRDHWDRQPFISCSHILLP